MASSDSEPSAWQRLTPLTDLITPMAVRVAATLRLADLLADGVADVDELARRTGTDPDALGRLLHHLAARGVIAQPSPGRFTINEVSELLRSDHPERMQQWLDLDGFGGRMDLAFAELLHTVRTGRPAWERVFGAPFWEYLAADPAIAASFDATMAGSPRATAATEYDWSGVRHVVDVGGGTGSMLAEVLQAEPTLRGTLVDLPDTVARARELLTERGLAERCDVVGQSFFEPLPAGADVYLLSGILHDWADEHATAILRRCAEAGGRDGRVVIVEYEGSTGGDPPARAEMDLRMLVLAGGRERGVAENEALATAAGLTVAHVHPTSSGHVLIDCRSRRGA